MPNTPEISVAEHLKKIPASLRPTVEAARHMVAAIAPTAKEVTYRSQPPRSSRSMWKLVRYSVGDAYVVGLGIYPSYASLFFYRGRELDSDGGLLEGGGKDMRFIRLHAPADAERPAVEQLVRNAFRLEGAQRS